MTITWTLNLAVFLPQDNHKDLESAPIPLFLFQLICRTWAFSMSYIQSIGADLGRDIEHNILHMVLHVLSSTVREEDEPWGLMDGEIDAQTHCKSTNTAVNRPTHCAPIKHSFISLASPSHAHTAADTHILAPKRWFCIANELPWESLPQLGEATLQRTVWIRGFEPLCCISASLTRWEKRLCLLSWLNTAWIRTARGCGGREGDRPRQATLIRGIVGGILNVWEECQRTCAVLLHVERSPDISSLRRESLETEPWRGRGFFWCGKCHGV